MENTAGGSAPAIQTMSVEAAQAAIPQSVQQLQERYEQHGARREGQWRQSLDIPKPPAGVVVPPLPDAPGGELDRQRMGGGR